jgi:hypothetical protein
LAQRYQVVLFFKDNLDREKRFDLMAREEAVNDGLRRVQTHFPNIIFGEPRLSSLSVTAALPGDQLGDLIDFMSRTKLGRVQHDAAVLKAARESVE